MSLIVPESIDIASLPSLVLAERKQLLNCAACYLVLKGETVVAHSTTMSEVIRQQITPFIKEGRELQRDETKVV